MERDHRCRKPARKFVTEIPVHLDAHIRGDQVHSRERIAAVTRGNAGFVRPPRIGHALCAVQFNNLDRSPIAERPLLSGTRNRDSHPAVRPRKCRVFDFGSVTRRKRIHRQIAICASRLHNTDYRSSPFTIDAEIQVAGFVNQEGFALVLRGARRKFLFCAHDACIDDYGFKVRRVHTRMVDRIHLILIFPRIFGIGGTMPRTARIFLPVAMPRMGRINIRAF